MVNSDRLKPIYEVTIVGCGASNELKENLHKEFRNKIDWKSVDVRWAPACVPEFLVELAINFSYVVAAEALFEALKKVKNCIREAVKKSRTSNFDEMMKRVSFNLPGCNITIFGNLSLDDYSELLEKIVSFVTENASSDNPISRVELPCVQLDDSLYTVIMLGDGSMPGEENYNLWSIGYADSPEKSFLYDYANQIQIEGMIVDFFEYNKMR
ncbi:MAG: hypothetical protein LBK67_08375 [Coriobacteriales bacterium]|jgi:hypothetical protein|nr:hypothetical protein [Coriobacteriales bacterium]